MNGCVPTTKQHCEWAVLTVVEDGVTASPQLRKFAAHVEQSRGASPRVANSPRRKLLGEPNKEAGPRGGTGRPDETSGTSASDGPTSEDDSEVQCNLKTLDEQHRAMLRKSGKQLFADVIDQPTTT